MQPYSPFSRSIQGGPLESPISLFAASLFFQALEKGDKKAILDFKEETLDKLDFETQELIKKFPTCIESLCSSAFSEDVACQGARILRKMIYRLITHKSQFIKGKVYFSFDAAKRLFKEGKSIHLEGIIMYELLKEGEQDTVDLGRCFQAICEQILKQGLFKEQELPQLAQKMQGATQRFFDVQNKVNAIKKEAQQSFAASEREKMKLLQADLDQAQQKMCETTQSFFSSLSVNPSKEWTLQALSHHVEKSFWKQS